MLSIHQNIWYFMLSLMLLSFSSVFRAQHKPIKKGGDFGTEWIIFCCINLNGINCFLIQTFPIQTTQKNQLSWNHKLPLYKLAFKFCHT